MLEGMTMTRIASSVARSSATLTGNGYATTAVSLKPNMMLETQKGV